jgi:hypothetical protein
MQAKIPASLPNWSDRLWRTLLSRPGASDLITAPSTRPATNFKAPLSVIESITALTESEAALLLLLFIEQTLPALVAGLLDPK